MRAWHFFAGLLVAVGLGLSAGWFGILVYMHSSYDAYIQVIHGPYPFSHLGSGPVQLWGSIGFGVLGLTAVIAGSVQAFSRR